MAVDLSVVLISAAVSGVVSGLFAVASWWLKRRASAGDPPPPLAEGDITQREIPTLWGFWKFTLPLAIPLVIGIVGWFWTDWQKQVADQYQRKEAKYKELLQSLQGFYDSTPAVNRLKLRTEFLDQLRQCWLYCSDDVIQKGYAFLKTVHTGQVHADEIKENALGEFVAAIRQDLLSRTVLRATKLTGADFLHLRALQ